MNRKQWFVWGIGLILLSFFLSYFSNTSSCSDLNDKNIELIEMGADNTAVSAIVTSCFDMAITMSAISSIIFTSGILFTICGFLEPKQKH